MFSTRRFPQIFSKRHIICGNLRDLRAKKTKYKPDKVGVLNSYDVTKKSVEICGIRGDIVFNHFRRRRVLNFYSSSNAIPYFSSLRYNAKRVIPRERATFDNLFW